MYPLWWSEWQGTDPGRDALGGDKAGKAVHPSHAMAMPLSSWHLSSHENMRLKDTFHDGTNGAEGCCGRSLVICLAYLQVPKTLPASDGQPATAALRPGSISAG